MEPFKNLLFLFTGACVGLMLMALTIDTTPKKIVETKEVILPPVEERFSQEKFIDFLLRSNIKHYKIVFAQAVIETGWFKSKSFKTANNLFGMKLATRRATTAVGEYLGHAKYNNWKESVLDYALYQSTYLSKFKSEEAYFAYLKSNYAEDPDYVAKIKSIIRKHF